MNTKSWGEDKPTEVVVLEDETEARKTIIDSLEEFTNPWGIKAFATEAEAQRFFEQQDIKFHEHHEPPIRLILLDLNIDGTRSFGTLKRLREMDSTRNTPIVVFSDSSNAGDIRKTYEHGANAFVTKPIGFEAFDEAVQAIAYFWLDMNRI